MQKYKIYTIIECSGEKKAFTLIKIHKKASFYFNKRKKSCIFAQNINTTKSKRHKT